MKSNILRILLAIIFALSPAFMTVSKAEEVVDEQGGYYELNEDGTYLYIEGNIDFSIVESFPDLSEMTISHAIIDDSFKIVHSSLHSIEFDSCDFSVDALNIVSNFDELVLRECELDDLKIISNLVDLTSLQLINCSLGSLNGIQNLKSLEFLTCMYVGIEHINEISGLEWLRCLTLLQTCVQDISPIADMNIEVLDISNSLNIKSLEPIKQLDSLLEFHAGNCEMLLTEDIIDYMHEKGIDTSYTIWDSGTESIVVVDEITYDDLDVKKQIKNIVKEIINDDMSISEKINTIVNYVIDYMEYDAGVYDDGELESIYNKDALKYALEGKGVCRNYTALTTVLMQEAGIDVYEVTNEDHIWNLVKIDDQYYWIDTTWLDGFTKEEILSSEYYMNNEEEFVDHYPNFIPSSMYNKIHNITPIEYEIIDVTPMGQETIEVDKDDYINWTPITITIICVTVILFIVIFIVVKKKKMNNCE